MAYQKRVSGFVPKSVAFAILLFGLLFTTAVFTPLEIALAQSASANTNLAKKDGTGGCNPGTTFNPTLSSTKTDANGKQGLIGLGCTDQITHLHGTCLSQNLCKINSTSGQPSPSVSSPNTGSVGVSPDTGTAGTAAPLSGGATANTGNAAGVNSSTQVPGSQDLLLQTAGQYVNPSPGIAPTPSTDLGTPAQNLTGPSLQSTINNFGGLDQTQFSPNGSAEEVPETSAFEQPGGLTYGPSTFSSNNPGAANGTYTYTLPVSYAATNPDLGLNSPIAPSGTQTLTIQADSQDQADKIAQAFDGANQQYARNSSQISLDTAAIQTIANDVDSAGDVRALQSEIAKYTQENNEIVANTSAYASGNTSNVDAVNAKQANLPGVVQGLAAAGEDTTENWSQVKSLWNGGNYFGAIVTAGATAFSSVIGGFSSMTATAVGDAPNPYGAAFCPTCATNEQIGAGFYTALNVLPAVNAIGAGVGAVADLSGSVSAALRDTVASLEVGGVEAISGPSVETTIASTLGELPAPALETPSPSLAGSGLTPGQQIQVNLQSAVDGPLQPAVITLGEQISGGGAKATGGIWEGTLTYPDDPLQQGTPVAVKMFGPGTEDNPTADIIQRGLQAYQDMQAVGAPVIPMYQIDLGNNLAVMTNLNTDGSIALAAGTFSPNEVVTANSIPDIPNAADLANSMADQAINIVENAGRVFPADAPFVLVPQNSVGDLPTWVMGDYDVVRTLEGSWPVTALAKNTYGGDLTAAGVDYSLSQVDTMWRFFNSYWISDAERAAEINQQVANIVQNRLNTWLAGRTSGQ